MSKSRLSTLRYENGRGRDTTCPQSSEDPTWSRVSKEHQWNSKTNQMILGESFTEKQAKDLLQDDSMLEALDNLTDNELDDLYERTLALNRRLKQHLRDGQLPGRMDNLETTTDFQRSRNTVVLPPIVKKNSLMANSLKANR